MRKVLTILCVLLLAVTLVAQVRTGNISGKVLDAEGNALPGVAMTLTGFTISAMFTTTSVDGSFRFLSLHPAKDYKIKAEIAGFKTKSETAIIVAVGATTELEVVMEIGVLEEEISVIAVSPIVDLKKTAVTTSVNYDTLQSLPSARDPWVVLQMIPSIQVDRENIGGSESGQQASFAALGGIQGDSVWTMDGVVITDPAAIGASPTYFDFDMFEEMQVTVGGADVETQTGGVALNFISRRGGNRVSMGGRFYYTDQKFQSAASGSDYDLVKEVFSEDNGYPEDAGYNHIVDIKDFGFNMGGPLWQDKAWWWGSYGVQEIKTKIITGSKDETFLTNFAAKINLQLVPANRFEFFIHSGKKDKFGRSSSSSNPLGWNQRGKFHFGSPIIKFQDEHMFGDDLFVSVQYGYTNSGFGMWPVTDLGGSGVYYWDAENSLATESSWWFFSGRPHKLLKATGSYFNDSFLGASHEIKFGAEYVDRGNEWVSQSAGANIWIDHNINYRTVDWDADGTIDVMKDDHGIDLMYVGFTPTWDGANKTKAWSAYLSDTMTLGRINVKLGLRYDVQTPWHEGQISQSIYTVKEGPETIDWWNVSSSSRVADAQAKILESGVGAAIAAIYPRMEVPAEHNTQSWNVFSPRVGITWDVEGNGRTVARVSGAIYGSYMGVWGGLWAKQGGGQAMRFYWHDADSNKKMALSELYWAKYDGTMEAYNAFDAGGNFVGDVTREENLMWWGYDFNNPTNLRDSRYQFDADWSSPKTYELLFSVEREIIPDLGVSVNVNWRRYNNWQRTARYAYEKGGELLEAKHYAKVGEVPSSFAGKDREGNAATIDTGAAGGKPWYAWKAGVKNVYERYRTNWPSDAYDQYIGVDFVVTKRLSKKWMFNGSFTYQSQNTYYDVGISDPTNIWAYSSTTYAPNMGGGSGKISQPVFSRWLIKAQGLYQLPYDFNVSFTFNAREGHILDYYIGIRDDDYRADVNASSYSNHVAMEEFGTSRLPTFWNLNMRVEKVLRLGDGRIYIMVDMFNVFNKNMMNRRRDYDYGTYYATDGYHSYNSRVGEPNEILNPRIFRLGVRFQF